MSLSDKEVDVCDEDWNDVNEMFYAKRDVKEFIRLLKENIRSYNDFEKMAINIMIDINKLAGEKLI